jgi:uncharacterized GH25 family protein
MIKRLLLLALLAVPVQAHDFWIEPSSFRPTLGETFTASLYVGQDFAGDPVPRSKSLLDAFVVRDAAGERAVNGFENQDPAGFVRIDEAGTAVIGYRSKPSPLEITPEKFAQFLREEGIRGVTVANKPHREHFYRYAKTIVQAGKASPAVAAKPLGYRLELVPLDAAHYQLLFEHKPLAGVQVVAIARDEEKKLSARTDAGGRVTFDLPSGVWLVKAVHLVRAPTNAGVEWESLWASLTFER